MSINKSIDFSLRSSTLIFSTLDLILVTFWTPLAFLFALCKRHATTRHDTTRHDTTRSDATQRDATRRNTKRTRHGGGDCPQGNWIKNKSKFCITPIINNMIVCFCKRQKQCFLKIPCLESVHAYEKRPKKK